MPFFTPVGGGGTPKATITGTTGSPSVDTTSRPGKTIYRFTGSGSVTIGVDGVLEMLLVGGGGSGGGNYNSGQSYGLGGGAGGGVIYQANQFLPAGTYTITVGAGGTGSWGGGSYGSPGSASFLRSLPNVFLQSPGGASGAASNGGPEFSYTGLQIAGSGGAGATNAYNGPATTPLYPGTLGYQGGNSNGNGAGGGGGNGQVGANAGPGYVSGNGGNGTQYSITGTSTYYAGGGGGGVNGTPGNGGQGGGGAGRGGTNGPAGNGTANTGGGGGGNHAIWGAAPGQGGSGIVILVVG